jgi:fatty acid desaturase
MESQSQNNISPEFEYGARVNSEMPTWLVIGLLYPFLYLLFTHAASMPWWLVTPLATIGLCVYGSLQHELIHNHPTRSEFFNSLFGWIPFNLWIPYPRYRDSHRLHHDVPTLAEPRLDPESYYIMRHDWETMNPLLKLLWKINYSFAGRMIIGPWIMVSYFFINEGKRLLRGDMAIWQAWAPHIILSALLLFWLDAQGVSWQFYLLGCVWPAASLLLMRSYTEHRDFGDQNERCAIVEGNWFTRLLFLNINIHQVHHEFPGMPWYRIYDYYRRNRESVNQLSGNFYFAGYLELIRKTLFKTKDNPVYQES